MAETRSQIRLAIEGCGHGTLHAIYASVAESCKQKGWPGVDLLIIGGDFQAVRNAYDLNCVSMPAKYREMCDFHEYYSGRRVAPYLTIFVGGNHEASNYLLELYYGGWVAPNIYYMGAANVLNLGGLRIAGLSGIWKGFDYRKPHLERLPFTEGDLKSIYHVRELDVRKLLQLRTQVDIGVSHDWPQGVEWKGNWKQLFRWKKHFEEDARTGRLGSVAAKQVLEWLRPRHWFSAHLHVKYAAVVKHDDATRTSEVAPARNIAEVKATKNDDEIDLEMSDDDGATPLPAEATSTNNADEIDLDLDDKEPESHPGQIANGVTAEAPSSQNTSNSTLASARAALPDSFSRPQNPAPPVHPEAIKNTTTMFLSLDKCLAGRDFLQLMSIDIDTDLDSSRPLKLHYDHEWLAITRAFALHEPPIFGDQDAQVPRARSHAEYAGMINEQLEWVDKNLNSLQVPENFQINAPVYDDGDFRAPQYQQSGGRLREYPNAQTASFCHLLQLPNPLEASEEALTARLEAGPREEPNGGFRGHTSGGRRGRGDGRGDRRGRSRFGGGRGRGRGR